MIFLSTAEKGTLTLSVIFTPVLRILLLCLSKGNYRLILSGYLPKFSVIYTLCDIVI